MTIEDKLECFMGFLFKRRSLFFILAVALAISFCFSFSVLNEDFVLGMSDFWNYPRGTIGGGGNDTVQVLVGYNFYAQAPIRFPIYYVQNLGWPVGTNIIFTDSIPIVATLGRVVSQLSGELANPYGIWVLVCLTLPGPLMALVVALRGQSNVIGAASASGIASCTPVLLFRWGHLPLMGQFLLIGGLALYLSPTSFCDRRLPFIWAGWLSLALLVNVYLFVMTGALFVTSLAQHWRDDRDFRAATLKSGGLVFSWLLLLMVICGHLNPDNPSGTSGGYGYFSLNLISLFVPQRSGLIPAWGNSIVDATGGQYEGFAYLGAGVLFLLFFPVPYLVHHLPELLRRHGFLVALLLGFIVFALSNRIYVGSWQFDTHVPYRLTQWAGIFRSSGRFVWPLVYVLESVAVVNALRYFPRRAAVTLLFVAVCVQWVDTRPLRAEFVASISEKRSLPIDEAVWRPQIAAASRVMVFPAYDCAEEAGRNVSIALQLLASQYNVPINAVYNARVFHNCEQERQKTERGSMEAGVLYVFISSKAEGESNGPGWLTNCRPFDGGVFCKART